MAGRIGEGQRAAAKLHRHALVRGGGAIGRHRHDAAVGAVHLGLPVDRQRALPQGTRVHHVAQAARVHQHAGLRQRLHQRAGTTGMVQVHMGGDDPVHRLS